MTGPCCSPSRRISVEVRWCRRSWSGTTDWPRPHRTEDADTERRGSRCPFRLGRHGNLGQRVLDRAHDEVHGGGCSDGTTLARRCPLGGAPRMKSGQEAPGRRFVLPADARTHGWEQVSSAAPSPSSRTSWTSATCPSSSSTKGSPTTAALTRGRPAPAPPRTFPALEPRGADPIPARPGVGAAKAAATRPPRKELAAPRGSDVWLAAGTATPLRGASFSLIRVNVVFTKVLSRPVSCSKTHPSCVGGSEAANVSSRSSSARNTPA